MTRCFAVAILVSWMSGPSTLSAGPHADPAPQESGSPNEVGYCIGPEDVLQILVWENEALSRTAPVRPDGKISLPLLNDVQAAGLTPLELRDDLMRRLREYMPRPEVSVIVTDVRSFKVSVLGQVPKPDRYELKSAATVMDVLAMAGGFTEFASRSRIVVIRSEGDKTVRIPFDYEKVRAGHPGELNFRLRPGDIVLVP
jgi:polysaccharide export outer membrane protein